MMAGSTDVRAWLREQGRDVPERGPVPRSLREEYDAAHRRPGPVIAGDPAMIEESDYPDLDPSGGVTEADFPPGDGDGGYADDAEGDGAPPPARGQRQAPAARERKPRTAGPPKRPGLRERLFGPPPKDGKRRKIGGGRARVPLGDFAEETWTDLAWLAAPLPPLAEMLTIQAPYAGAVFDEQVKGTVADAILQPIARNANTFRALSGLVGPPVYVAAICATGQQVEVPVIDPATGLQARTPEGVGIVTMDFDGRTKMLFMGLRYSLLQMVKISDRSIEAIEERAQAAAENNRKVEAIIARIFGTPPPGPPAPPAAPHAPAGQQQPNGIVPYAYPDPAATAMDGAGADPGRGM